MVSVKYQIDAMTLRGNQYPKFQFCYYLLEFCNHDAEA